MNARDTIEQDDAPARPEQAPVPEQAEHHTPPADHDAPRPDGQDAKGEADARERHQGWPAGQLAIGGLSAAAALLAGLYQLAGPWGLAAGGATTVGGGALAYTVRRRRRDRTLRPFGATRRGRRATSAPSSGTGRTGGRGGGRAGGLLGRRTRRTATRLDSPHRAPRTVTARSVRPAGWSKRSGAGRGHTGQGSLGGHHRRRTGRATTGNRHGARRVMGGAVRATRRGAAKVGGAVRASGRGVRRGGAWVDRKTGHRAGRAFTAPGRAVRRAGRGVGRGGRAVGRAAGRGARRAGAWADRRTGRRASTAWAAARTARGFRQARRAALAARSGARRWDAEMTAGLVALVAWLSSWWRRRRTPATAQTHNAEKTTTAEKTTAEKTTTGHQEDTSTTTTAAPKPRPTDSRSTDSRTYRRRTPVMTFPLAATAAEMNAAAAGYAPADMWVVARELDQLNEVPAYVALAIRTYTQRLQSEYPINGAVVEAIHRLYQAQVQLVSLAEEIGPLFRRVHADDLKREEAPRTNEPLWNV